MNPRLRTSIKRALSRLLPDSPRLRYLGYLPKLETWRRGRSESFPCFATRLELYRHVQESVLGDGPLDYLEFGVFEGESIGQWAGLNRHPESRFTGFDTFSGLPETWDCFTGQMGSGAFDTRGKVPDIADPRVSFVPGLFQQTLPGFLMSHPPRARLVLHNDCDLYASTLYVLTRCHDRLEPGAIVIFDEFSSMMHEFRALEDYCASYMRQYDVLGATIAPDLYYGQIAIRMK